MKHVKKLLSLVLALALVLPALLTPASAAANVSSFPDVKPGEWFYPYVTQLARVGGVHGFPDGTFKPTAIISRAEVATIAVNLFPPDQFLNDYCPDAVRNEFTRGVENALGRDHWAKDAVLKACLCIGSLYYIDINGWEQPATRADIALILARTYVFAMYGLGKLDLPLAIPTDEEGALLIGDFDKIKNLEAAEDILWLYSEGIISGVNDHRDFNPQGTATRAECCKIAVNLLDPSQRDVVDWDKILSGGNPGGGLRYEKDFTGKERARYPGDVAFDYCRALENEIGIQIFYIPYEWTEKADGLISSDEAAQVIAINGLDNFFPAVLTELKKMKAAFDKYPDGFLKEMAKKKGSRTAEIILCPYTFEGMQFYGRYVYDESSDAKKVDQVYYTGVGDTHAYSHEMGHMVTSAVGILNGWNTTCAAWDKMRTADWGSYISNYAVTSRPEDQAETWAYLWEQPQTVIQACSNAGLKAKVRYLTQILDKNYSTFHANQVPWASVLK